MDSFVTDVCIKCGHPDPLVEPLTQLCGGCLAKQEWEDKKACRRCYVNERDPRSRLNLCYVCDNAQGRYGG